MYREKRRNKIIIMILIGIICLMGVGYAAFQTRLNITGTSEISSDWNIRIISADVTEVGGDGENVKNNYSDLTADLEANLYEKGDYVEYSIIVENKGTFDAKLETIGITNSNNEAVKITSTGLTKGQVLYQGTTATLKVKIEYNSAYEGDASGTSGESTVNLDFVQNSGGTIEPETSHLVTYDYTTNGGESTNAENEYINEGENINLSYTAEKDGYNFVGWNTDSNSKEGLQELTMGTSDITLYAIFKKPDDTPPVIENVSTSSTTNSITVVTTASDSESGISKYEFKIDDNEWIDNDTNNVYTFTGLTQNTGYDISVRVTNGVDLTTEEEVSASLNLTDNVVSSGDGLYKDEYEEGRYVYKGLNPNNYVTFNAETAGWRIISLEKNGTMKIISLTNLGPKEYDTINNRPTSSNTYCKEASTYGCHVWSAIDETFTGGSISGTVTKDASINTYLNNDYYNTLTSEAKNQITDANYNIGILSAEETNLSETIKQEKTYTWTGKIGMVNASDYIKSSTTSQCVSINFAYNNAICKDGSYLRKEDTRLVTINGRDNNSRAVIYVENTGKMNNQTANLVAAIYPVVYLKNSVNIVGGDGSKENPFILGNGILTNILDKPTFSEEQTDNGKTVTITYPEGEGLTYEYQKDGENWVNATQGQQVKFTEGGTLVARVSDGINIVTNSYNIEFDSTPPVISNVSTSSTTNTVQVVTSATDEESDIIKYEFKIGNNSWVDNGASNSYTFTGLTHNTNYTVQTRVTNSEGLVSDITSKQVSTTRLNIPTFSQTDISSGVRVTITYPSGNRLTYQYKKDNGLWQSASRTQTVTFTESGTLVARVSDGTNTVNSSTYTVEVVGKGASGIIDEAGIVTSGDGLYKDSYESNVYTYRGSNPNNYVTFNGEQWRIISVKTSDNTIKIMRNAAYIDMAFDIFAEERYNIDHYCNIIYGCNIYGSTSSLYDRIGKNLISVLARDIGDVERELPSKESEISIYLNGDYYNGLNKLSKNMIKEDAVYKVGVLNDSSGQHASSDMTEVNAVKWKGKVALIDATEYVRSSTNSSCTSVGSNSYSDACSNNNWMNNSTNYWTISPYAESDSDYAWDVGSVGLLTHSSVYYELGVRPVVTLSPEVQITGGNGSSSDPYTLTI